MVSRLCDDGVQGRDGRCVENSSCFQIFLFVPVCILLPAGLIKMEAIALRLEAIATRMEATALRLEAIVIKMEAIALRLEAIATRMEATAALRLDQDGGHRS